MSYIEDKCDRCGRKATNFAYDLYETESMTGVATFRRGDLKSGCDLHPVESVEYPLSGSHENYKGCNDSLSSEHAARGPRLPAHLRGAHRIKPPEELDRIADKVLSYRPKDKAKKLKTKARKVKKGAKRGRKI